MGTPFGELNLNPFFSLRSLRLCGASCMDTVEDPKDAGVIFARG